MEIRGLEAADAARYWELRLRALREEPEAFGSSYAEVVDRPLEAVAERLRPRLEPPEGLTLGAWVAGEREPTPPFPRREGGGESAGDDAGERLVGTVTCMREPQRKVAHKAMITGMYVAPEQRGQGIGKALLGAAIARARGWAGVEQVVLSVVATNAVALGLYTAVGFVVFGHEPHALKLDGRYLDEDHLILWLRDAPGATERAG